MKNISLERATIQDLKEIINIEESVVGLNTYGTFDDKKEARDYLNNKTVYLIKKDNKAIGRIAYEIKNNNAHIYDLVIKPDFQGQGIAREALTSILKELKDIKSINLIVHPHNTPALMLYLSLGFTIEAWEDSYYGDGEPRLVMVLEK